MNYNPIYKPDQLILGTGRTAIATGWTLKSTIAKKLDPSEYAAVGQFYSINPGINLFIRNLLANPSVSHVVAIAATKEDVNSGSCYALADFFLTGVTQGKSELHRDCWVTDGVPGYLDLEIPKHAIDDLRARIKFSFFTSVKAAIQKIKYIAESAPQTNQTEPQIFSIPELKTSINPGTLYGHRIEGATIAETWVKIIQRIKSTGRIRQNQHGGEWQELIDLTAIVTDEPDENYFPSYLPISKEFFTNYKAQILDDAIASDGVKYTYGQRLRSHFGVDQIAQVIAKLKSDPNSTRAVMSLWDKDDHNNAYPPCLNHIWVRIADGSLSLTATFRSNDMYSAWPANAMGLRALQRHLRDEIDSTLQLAPLIIISQSAHIYDDCWNHAQYLIDNEYPKIASKKDYADPVGNFCIELLDGQIQVTHVFPNGEFVKIYSGKQPLALLRDITQSNPGVQSDHAGYLGIELQKAFECLRDDSMYSQDRG